MRPSGTAELFCYHLSMKKETPKLIIIRGNSGSGKSTVAKKLREASSHNIAIVEQDYLRRFILKEKETEGIHNIGLIKQTIEYALQHGYDVVLEGILYFSRYGKMLNELTAKWPNNFVYYFDASLEETLSRHTTKPNAHEFGEKEMREWYRHKDLTGFENEVVISEASSLSATVNQILRETRLS